MNGGYFTASQKIVSTTPILKKASLDPLDLGNYRPISNLTFLSKLLERAAYEQIVGYMECHHLLPLLQLAHQKHRSTETATIKVMSDIYPAADAGLVHAAQPSRSRRRFRYCQPHDPSGSTSTPLRHLDTRSSGSSLTWQSIRNSPSIPSKLKSHLIIVYWFFSFFFIYFIIVYSFFSLTCMRTWCSLAGTTRPVQMCELNWMVFLLVFYMASPYLPYLPHSMFLPILSSVWFGRF